MKKIVRYLVITICIIAVLIIILGLKAASISDEYGTYVAGDEKSETAVDYVFGENGDFAFYSQLGKKIKEAIL